MSDPTDISCSEIPGYELLKELALDLIWSWTHCGDTVWKRLDPSLWELTHNPWVVLQTVSRDKLANALADPEFCQVVRDLVERNRAEAAAPRWFQKNYAQTNLHGVVYFSMEFMLSEALPIYSGGLGNVAGDQLKAASDLGVPVTAIGLLYQQGYFRQLIDVEGRQQALYPYNDPGQLPISPLRKANGEWLRIEIPLPGWSLWLRVWQVKVGRLRLFLIDSNDPANYPPHRGITSELYGGDSELRLKQEMLLGIGGWRILEALDMKPQVCHLNEGHAAFAILERARNFMLTSGQSFAEALESTRAGNLFTTHTAVTAGFDRFSPQLIQQYLGKYAQNQLHISEQELLALGRLNPQDENEPFNMAYLALRGSGAVNAVSKLHGEVSRKIFAPLFPRWPEAEIPIGYVTNGVHAPSWDSAAADKLWTEAAGQNRWLGSSTEELESALRGVPDATIWQMRNENRNHLIEYARSRLSRMLAARGTQPEIVEQAKTIFDPNALTLGFARRFATYKRPNLLLSDRERLLRILNNPERPVQLIIAGKAHPADKPGQALIAEWIHFIREHISNPKVIFLSDYDMLMTEQLVQGVDVWINTPRRPWEACGTSGMKVLVNGGLNLSELDGWWVEAYRPEVGWALGDGCEHGDDPQWDAAEAAILYDIIENQVVPEFYERNAEGIPERWLKRVRESMATLTPHYSANRAVREYTEKYYLPAAEAVSKRLSKKGEMGTQIQEWRGAVAGNWSQIHFDQLNVTTEGDLYRFEVQAYLHNLDPQAVQFEVFAAGNGTGVPSVTGMTLAGPGQSPQTYIFRAEVPVSRPASDYTVRIVPHHADVQVPLEAAEILWQH